MDPNAAPKVCLSIAGLDPSGGAGIIADVKTFSAFGCFAAAAVTSITFQNTMGVFGSISQSRESIRGQVEPIFSDYPVSAVKTGMLPTREVIEETARLIAQNGIHDLVVDPVVRSTSGYDLIDEAAIRALIEILFPLACVVTPNIPEAERITGVSIEDDEDIERAGEIMLSFGAKAVLIKGGHFDDRPLKESSARHASGKNKALQLFPKGRKAIDVLFTGNQRHVFKAEYIKTGSTHGTGCTLSAAITANLAHGKDLISAIDAAKIFVTEAIRTAPQLGRGHSPINIFHFPAP